MSRYVASAIGVKSNTRSRRPAYRYSTDIAGIATSARHRVVASLGKAGIEKSKKISAKQSMASIDSIVDFLTNEEIEMSNMSYCRFQNTLIDFRDCVNTVEAMQYDGFDLSHEERKAFAMMLEQAVTLIQMVGDAVGLLDSDMIQSCIQDPDEVADKFAATCLNVDSEGAEE